jgi:Flp pilus assembly protein TadD
MVIAFLFLTTSTAFAEKVTFVKEYNYNASDLDSKVSSRAIALEQVKRLLLEELGTYLISETEVKNFRLTKDQITTYSAGVVSAEIMDEKWDGKTYYLKAKVAADPAEVTKSLQNIVNDKHKSKELEDIRKKATEFSKEIERLKKDLEIAKTDNKQMAQKTDTKKVAQYNKAVKGLTATDWFEQGVKFYGSGNFKEAINAYNRAIELNPQYAEANIGRGLAYEDLGNFQQAINDFSKAIELKPRSAEAYYRRGAAYYRLVVYGGADDKSGNFQRAINDLSKTIELEPRNIEAYSGRGLAYDKLGNYQQAVNDFTKTTQLDPQNASAYIKLGLAYGNLGNYQQAINAYSKAIKVFPKYSEAYYRRGAAYLKLNNEQKGIADIKIAAKLGSYEAKDYLKQKGIGW